ncbi:type IV pilin-like G/H family protein [Geitlerinema sp. CS-897]|nr:type IV pilin-like G/H family protein [Geitlerinema sp. CS-897]
MRLPQTLLYVLTLSLVACRQEASVTARWHEEPVKYLRLAVLFESANYTTTGNFVENFDRVGVTVPDETQDYRYAIERLDSRRVRIVARPKADGLHSAIAAVVGYDGNARDAICVSDDPASEPPKFPTIPANFAKPVRCPPGSSGGELYELSPVNRSHESSSF